MNEITCILQKSNNHIFEYIMEWCSSYENDLMANSLLMLILQQDANILSPVVRYVNEFLRIRIVIHSVIFHLKEVICRFHPVFLWWIPRYQILSKKY